MTYRLVAADGQAPSADIYDSLFDADEHGRCPPDECIRGYCLIERTENETPLEARA